MPIILSLALCGETLYAAGPDGLFRVDGGAPCDLAQPMERLYCVAAAGETLLVGGAPHGVAFRTEAGEWQAGWMDHVRAPAVAIAPAPDVEQSGVLLAASAGDGLLRTTNRGHTWSPCNFGLHAFNLLCVVWAGPPPAGRWPARDVVFCGSERGCYRSPAAGLGWRKAEGPTDAVQAIAVSPHFHENGVVLAGCEEGGLWQSADGGRNFAPVAGMEGRIDALAATPRGWVAATPAGLSVSGDAVSWRRLDGLPSALCFVDTPHGLYYGNESGLGRLAPDDLPGSL